MLGRYQSDPGLDYWKVAKKVLKYLQGIKNHMLTYRKSDHLEVIGYTYSYFSGCMDTRKSTFSYVYLLAGRAISWKSVKESVIVASTMEVEFQANWLQNFISRLAIVDNIAKSLRIYCDKSTTIFFSKNN